MILPSSGSAVCQTEPIASEGEDSGRERSGTLDEHPGLDLVEVVHGMLDYWRFTPLRRVRVRLASRDRS